MLLLHGTTQARAYKIALGKPDPRYREKDGVLANDGFSTYVKGGIGQSILGDLSEYACGKAEQNPDEGGPAVLEFDCPDHVLATIDQQLYPVHQGIIVFDEGFGLETLLAVWENLEKRILIFDRDFLDARADDYYRRAFRIVRKHS